MASQRLLIQGLGAGCASCVCNLPKLGFLRARVLVAEASLWGAANILLGRPHTSIADAELQQAHCGLMCGQTDIEGGTALKTSHEAT